MRKLIIRNIRSTFTQHPMIDENFSFLINRKFVSGESLHGICRKMVNESSLLINESLIDNVTREWVRKAEKYIGIRLIKNFDELHGIEHHQNLTQFIIFEHILEGHTSTKSLDIKHITNDGGNF